MDYNHITSFLDKFKKILFEKEEIYKIISKVIKKHTSCLIKPSSIKIKKDSIYIESSPIIKNEILINKNKILFELKELIKNPHLRDIK